MMSANILNTLGYKDAALTAPRSGSDGRRYITFTKESRRYAVKGFPRTNNNMELTIRAITMHPYRASNLEELRGHIDGEACLSTRLTHINSAF